MAATVKIGGKKNTVVTIEYRTTTHEICRRAIVRRGDLYRVSMSLDGREISNSDVSRKSVIAIVRDFYEWDLIDASQKLGILARLGSIPA